MPQPEEQQQSETGNTVSGGAGQVVQAHSIAGGVHVHTPQLALPSPRQLPPAPTHFTGRVAALAKLDILLGDEELRRTSNVAVSVIAGTAGIGKTSLAVTWAHRVQDQFPDGQLYINLRGYDPSPPLSTDRVLETFLRALGQAAERIPPDTGAMAALYRSILAGRRILVVLDNAATPDQVRPLLPSDPGCAVLVTSRSRLSGLVARDGAHRLSLDLLAPSEAIELLRDVVGSDRTEGQSHAISQIARQCSYLPLALRVAAERVAARPQWAWGDLVRQLTAEHRRLDTLAADDDEATAVRTVFSWSYNALGTGAARLFCLLGLHPGADISIDAAAALADSGPEETRQLLNTLVAVHLLTENDRDRFHFHDLLRSYAAEKAVISESRDQCVAAVQRLFEWYLHTTHAALFAFYPQHPVIPIAPRSLECNPLNFENREQARTWFAAEHVNLMAIVRHAPTVGQHIVGWQLPNALDCYLADGYHMKDRLTVHRLGLAAAEHLGDRMGQIWACLCLGETYQETRRFNESIAYLNRALDISLEIGYEFGEGCALGDLASTYNALGRHQESAELSRQALQIYQALHHRRNEANSLVKLGNALRGMGQINESRPLLQRAFDIFGEIGASGAQAWTCRSLARVDRDQGKHSEAVGHLQWAAAHYREAQGYHSYAETLKELGELLSDIDRLDEARVAWHQALAIMAELDQEQAIQLQGLLEALDS